MATLSRDDVLRTLRAMGLPEPTDDFDTSGTVTEVVDRVFAQLETEHGMDQEAVFNRVLAHREQLLGQHR